MKVKQIIEELSKFDGDLDVLVNSDNCPRCDIENVFLSSRGQVIIYRSESPADEEE